MRVIDRDPPALPGQPLDAPQQGRVVQTAVAVGAGGGHQLGDQRAERVDHAGLPRGGGDDAHVLVVQVDPEAGLEVARQHVRPLLVEHRGTGQPAAEHLQGRLGVDAVRLQEDDGLGEQPGCSRRRSAGSRP